MGLKLKFYLVNAFINSAFFKEVYPVIPFSLAKAFNSATVFELKLVEAVAFGSAFLAFGVAFVTLGSSFVVTFFATSFFFAPVATMLEIWISVKAWRCPFFTLYPFLRFFF